MVLNRITNTEIQNIQIQNAEPVMKKYEIIYYERITEKRVCIIDAESEEEAKESFYDNHWEYDSELIDSTSEEVEISDMSLFED